MLSVTGETSGQPLSDRGQEQPNTKTRKTTLHRQPTRVASEVTVVSGTSVAVTHPPVRFFKMPPQNSDTPYTSRLSQLPGSLSIPQPIWRFPQVTRQAGPPRQRTMPPPVVWRPRSPMRPLLTIPLRVHIRNHPFLGTIGSAPMGACNGRNHFFDH